MSKKFNPLKTHRRRGEDAKNCFEELIEVSGTVMRAKKGERQQLHENKKVGSPGFACVKVLLVREGLGIDPVGSKSVRKQRLTTNFARFWDLMT